MSSATAPPLLIASISSGEMLSGFMNIGILVVFSFGASLLVAFRDAAIAIEGASIDKENRIDGI